MKIINLNFILTKRVNLNLTLQEMAESMGFKNASTYSKYEKGEYEFKANQLPILAEKLQCKMSDLFFEQNFAEIANNDKPA